MTTETNNLEATANLALKKGKPSIEQLLNWLDENIEAADHDIQVIMQNEDGESTKDEIESYCERIEEQKQIIITLKEHLLAVRLFNEAHERRSFSKNEAGRLMASNIKSQIEYIEACLLTTRKAKAEDPHEWMEVDIEYNSQIAQTLRMAEWMIQQVGNQLLELPGNQPTSIIEELDELVNALREATDALRGDEETARPTYVKCVNILSKYEQEEVSHG